MTAFQSWLANPHIQVLGWALLNFVWQGTLIAAVLKGTLMLMRRRSTDLRYCAAAAALLLMLSLPVISFWKPHLAPPPISRKAGIAKPVAIAALPAIPYAAGPLHALPPLSTGQTASARLEFLPQWFCVFWFAGVIVASATTLGGWLKAQLLKKDASPPAADGWRCRFGSLAHRSGIYGPVRLLESKRIAVPTVIGWLRPAVLLPCGTDLAPEQMDALLAHELAHIRRHDYLANLFQTAIEALLFYHPAVWWVSLQVRAERECCCDDSAVAVCGDTLTYVRALSEAEHRRSSSKLAVAVSSAPLLNRIRRLTEMRMPQSSRFAWAAGVFGVGLIFAAAAGSTILAYVPVHFEQTPAGAATQALPATQSQANPATPMRPQHS